MKIHSLLILDKSGICVYNRNFTETFQNLDINLVTPFLSALFSFAEKTLSRNLDELEMSGLRFMFSIMEEHVFVLVADTSVNLIFGDSRLEEIMELFYDYKTHSDFSRIKQIDDENFDEKIDSIISGQEELFKNKKFFENVIELFKGQIWENEIAAASMISIKGSIIYSSLPEEVLLRSIREFELRFMTGAMNLPEMYYSMENGQKVFSKIINHPRSGNDFFVVILYESNIPLGLAQLKLESITEEIEKMLERFS